MIKYVSSKRNTEGNTVHTFVVNGMQKDIAETELKQYPGYYDALPSAAKQAIGQKRAWIRKLNQELN